MPGSKQDKLQSQQILGYAPMNYFLFMLIILSHLLVFWIIISDYYSVLKYIQILFFSPY